MPATARTAPLTRRGPPVHVYRADAGWVDGRAFLVVRPLQCGVCHTRVERGETVTRPLGVDFACGSCVLHHIRGETRCPLCQRLKRCGPRCRSCGGSGYGEID